MFTHREYGDCIIDFMSDSDSDRKKFNEIRKVVNKVIDKTRYLLSSEPKPKYVKFEDKKIVEGLEKIIDLKNDYTRHTKIQTQMNLYRTNIIEKSLALLGIYVDEKEVWYTSDKYTDDEIGKFCFLFGNFLNYGNFVDILRFIHDQGVKIAQKDHDELHNLNNIYNSLENAVAYIEKGVAAKYHVIVDELWRPMHNPSKQMSETDLYLNLFESEEECPETKPRAKRTSKPNKKSKSKIPTQKDELTTKTIKAPVHMPFVGPSKEYEF